MTDLLVAAAGAVFGAFATLLFELLRQKSVEKKREWDALDLLLLDLAGRRVFSIPERRLIADPDTSADSDFDQMKRSVLRARAEIRSTLEAVRTGSPARLPLREMHRHCNVYLETVQTDPSRYWIAADDLRSSLDEEARTISSHPKTKVMFVAPGSEAL